MSVIIMAVPFERTHTRTEEVNKRLLPGYPQQLTFLRSPGALPLVDGLLANQRASQRRPASDLAGQVTVGAAR